MTNLNTKVSKATASKSTLPPPIPPHPPAKTRQIGTTPPIIGSNPPIPPPPVTDKTKSQSVGGTAVEIAVRVGGTDWWPNAKLLQPVRVRVGVSRPVALQFPSQLAEIPLTAEQQL